jgi:hypothetical protein
VHVGPGEDLAAIANDAPKDTTFCISGFHRLSAEIVPKDGQRFIGIDHAVLNGSRVLTESQPTGEAWVATGQTQDFSQAEPKISEEQCMDGYEGCNLPEDVYMDGVFLHKVMSLDELEAGRYFFDYAADEIYLADDPSGHTVVASVIRRAFANYNAASNVEVRGLVIEEFSAHSAEDGAIAAFNGKGWLVTTNDIRFNHGSGIMVSGTQDMVIRDNVIHHNGCGGIMGSASVDLLIDHNEIALNNALNFRSDVWSCGGGKLNDADGVVFRDNYVHDNNGFGFWTDGNNIRVRYERNLFVRNAMGGVMHEINDGTDGATAILDNVFQRNGYDHPNRIMLGAGIVISASNYVEVAGNRLVDNANGITINFTPRENASGQDLSVHDVSVHDNIIVSISDSMEPVDGGRVGFYTSLPGAPLPTAVQFGHNQYFLGSVGTGDHFSLPDVGQGFTLSTMLDWQKAGFDTSSEYLSVSEFSSGS